MCQAIRAIAKQPQSNVIIPSPLMDYCRLINQQNLFNRPIIDFYIVNNVGQTIPRTWSNPKRFYLLYRIGRNISYIGWTGTVPRIWRNRRLEDHRIINYLGQSVPWILSNRVNWGGFASRRIDWHDICPISIRHSLRRLTTLILVACCGIIMF